MRSRFLTAASTFCRRPTIYYVCEAMSQRRRRGHGHTRGSCIIYRGGTTAVLPLSLVQQTSMEITRMDPHGFSTIVHRGFTTDTAVLLWIHTDLVQRAAANLLRTRERRARRSTERIVQEENFGLDYRASEGPRGQVDVRGRHLSYGGRVLEASGRERIGLVITTGPDC